jgi:hypothetical protein
VRNIAYQKTVAVRFTLDDWHTTNDVLAKHEQSLEELPDGFTRSRSGVRKRVADVVLGGGGGSTSALASASSTSITPVWDRFRFEIRMSDYEESVRAGRVRGMWIVARYFTDGSSEGGGRQGKAMEWWDNNAGANYWVGFRCVAGGGRERERRRGVLVSAPRELFFFCCFSNNRLTPLTVDSRVFALSYQFTRFASANVNGDKESIPSTIADLCFALVSGVLFTFVVFSAVRLSQTAYTCERERGCSG